MSRRVYQEGYLDALQELADELKWERPDTCPCDHPEACCGSAESCDAMQPFVRVIGRPTLLKRIERKRLEFNG